MVVNVKGSRVVINGKNAVIFDVSDLAKSTIVKVFGAFVKLEPNKYLTKVTVIEGHQCNGELYQTCSK